MEGALGIQHLLLQIAVKDTHNKKGILLVFTVLAVVVQSTFTGVAVGGTRFANAGGNVLTGVELASIHTLLTKITCRTQENEE